MSILVQLFPSKSEFSRLEKIALGLGQELADTRGLKLTISSTPIGGLDQGFDAAALSARIISLADEKDCSIIILPHDSRGKSIAGLLAAKWNATVGSDVVGYSADEHSFVRSSHSGKSRSVFSGSSDRLVLTVSGGGEH